MSTPVIAGGVLKRPSDALDSLSAAAAEQALARGLEAPGLSQAGLVELAEGAAAEGQAGGRLEAGGPDRPEAGGWRP